MNRKGFGRLIPILLMFTVMLCTFPAEAEDIGLAGMTDREIISLLERVNGEIAKRGIEKTAILARGTYIAGVDIPTGKYVFTCLAKGEDWGNVTVYSERGEGDMLLWEVMKAAEEGEEPEKVFISLNEGDQLKSGVDFSLTIMPGIVFR